MFAEINKNQKQITFGSLYIIPVGYIGAQLLFRNIQKYRFFHLTARVEECYNGEKRRCGYDTDK